MGPALATEIISICFFAVVQYGRIRSRCCYSQHWGNSKKLGVRLVRPRPLQNSYHNPLPDLLIFPFSLRRRSYRMPEWSASFPYACSNVSRRSLGPTTDHEAIRQGTNQQCWMNAPSKTSQLSNRDLVPTRSWFAWLSRSCQLLMKRQYLDTRTAKLWVNLFSTKGSLFTGLTQLLEIRRKEISEWKPDCFTEKADSYGYTYKADQCSGATKLKEERANAVTALS